MKLAKYLPKPKRPRLFAIRRVVGESMMPALAPGKIVVAIKSVHVKPGDIIFLRHDGLEKIKRVKRIQDGKFFVVGDNPAKSTDSRTFGPIDRKTVLAKVVWPAT